MGESIRGEAVDQSISVAKVVVEPGADNAGRQRVADVADVLPNLIPDVGNLGGCRRPFQVDEDGREAGLRVAAQKIEALGFLKFALEPFGDLLKRVVECRAGPGRLHDHRSEGEGGILAAAEPEIGGEAGDGHGDHHEDDERSMLQRPFGKIGAGHEGAPSNRTFWPGWSA